MAVSIGSRKKSGVFLSIGFLIFPMKAEVHKSEHGI